jgi:hypothetical protein
LLNDNGSASSSVPLCGVPASTENQVRAYSSMVKQFYEEAHSAPDGSRRLQEAIRVGVNFVIVKNAAGLGATEDQVQPQIDVLNAAFGPDFVFNLTSTQVVTNDIYFSNLRSPNDPEWNAEREMKTAYKRGGTETMSVYAVQTEGGWAFTGGVQDGVVMDYTGVPNGGNWWYSKGHVSNVGKKF